MKEKSYLFDQSPIKYECWVYHDESKRVLDNKSWAHILFFVPESASSRLLEQLKTLRNEYNCDNKLHFSGISGNKFCRNDGSIVM
ncbi:MAG: hypothetical protein ACK4OO_02500, partial [bacterium]